MIFRQYHPAPAPLDDFIEMFWSLTGGRADSPRQRVMPHCGMQLVINLAGRKLTFFDSGGAQSVRAPLLAGPYTRSFHVDPAEYTAVLGVRFRPGAARLFFPVPAHELHNADLELDDLFPSDAERLRDQLHCADGVHQQLEILQRYLVGKLPRARPLHPAVEHGVREFLRQPGARAIADVQSETGLSHTRFNQLFLDSVGITPKLFCRLQRFQSVLRELERRRDVRWAGIASDCGYFDQAHLINDFRAFAGMTPSAYAEWLAESRQAAAAS